MVLCSVLLLELIIGGWGKGWSTAPPLKAFEGLSGLCLSGSRMSLVCGLPLRTLVKSSCFFDFSDHLHFSAENFDSAIVFLNYSKWIIFAQFLYLFFI